jgi:hypothetical protein
VEWLAAEYGISFSEAVWTTPLVIALVMMPVRNERHGGTSGPSYVTRAGNTASSKATRFLETHFRIVPKSVEETGWKLGENTILRI